MITDPNRALQRRQRLDYFVPGELVLVVDHVVKDGGDPGLVQQTIAQELERLLEKLQGTAGRNSPLRALRIEPARILTFDVRGRDQDRRLPLRPFATPLTHFSLAFISAPLGPLTPDDPEHHRLANQHLVQVIEHLYKLAASLPQELASNQPVVRAVMPNWYVTPFPDYTGGGSPGSRPVPPAAPPSPDAGAFKLPSWLQEAGPQAVEVVILDTAPDPQRLHQARNTSLNPLLDALLAPGGLRIQDQDPNGLALPFGTIPPATIPGHDYNMSDHGLFIAGSSMHLHPLPISACCRS